MEMMIEIRKRVVMANLEGNYKCLVYDIDYSGHKRPLNVKVYPIKWVNSMPYLPLSK